MLSACSLVKGYCVGWLLLQPWSAASLDAGLSDAAGAFPAAVRFGVTLLVSNFHLAGCVGPPAKRRSHFTHFSQRLPRTFSPPSAVRLCLAGVEPRMSSETEGRTQRTCPYTQHSSHTSVLRALPTSRPPHSAAVSSVSPSRHTPSLHFTSPCALIAAHAAARRLPHLPSLHCSTVSHSSLFSPLPSPFLTDIKKLHQLLCRPSASPLPCSPALSSPCHQSCNSPLSPAARILRQSRR